MNHQERLSSILAPEQVCTSQQELQHYGRDWLQHYTPDPLLIVFPKNTDEVVQVLKYCHDQGLAVVPSGGRTGLSGGATATQGEVVLSLERMRKILEFDAVARTVRCQAGVPAEAIQSKCDQENLLFPIDLASKGSAQIGGNVATNAGGIRVLRYGNIRNWVLGLEVVTGAGEVLQLGGKLVKDQTGYDLRQLFIGSEGTLGIITEVTLLLARKPGHVMRAVCALPSLEQVLPFFQKCRDSFAGLSVFEFFMRNALQTVVAHRGIRDPFPDQHPFYILIEVEYEAEEEYEEIQNRIAKFLGEGLISDAVLAASMQQAEELMTLREGITEALSAQCVVHKNDLSVPVASSTQFIQELSEVVKEHYPEYRATFFGHIGDGNIHVAILKPEHVAPEEFFEKCKQADQYVFELVQKFAGSVSAEHGVGLLKREYLSFTKSKQEVELMGQIKKVLDPKGMFNPGKILPALSKD